jgi:hypothetical protein
MEKRAALSLDFDDALQKLVRYRPGDPDHAAPSGPLQDLGTLADGSVAGTLLS